MDTDWALSELRKFIELTTLRQPSSDGGIVFLGDFADRAQAQQARANLPRELALYRPLLRTIQGVKDGAKPNTLKNQAIEKAS